VLLRNVDVGVAPTRPQKWSTQSAMIVTPIGKTTNFFYMFTLKTFLIGFYRGFVVFLSKLEDRKTTLWSLSLTKPLKSPKPKPPLQNKPS
jgi:hypothetical protein